MKEVQEGSKSWILCDISFIVLLEGKLILWMLWFYKVNLNFFANAVFFVIWTGNMYNKWCDFVKWPWISNGIVTYIAQDCLSWTSCIILCFHEFSKCINQIWSAGNYVQIFGTFSSVSYQRFGIVHATITKSLVLSLQLLQNAWYLCCDSLKGLLFIYKTFGV